MTNTEYEAASIAAAGCYDRFEGEHRLKQYDEMIAQVEKTLARLQEERRELVNRYDLNKCEHDWVKFTNDSMLPGREVCKKCELMR